MICLAPGATSLVILVDVKQVHEILKLVLLDGHIQAPQAVLDLLLVELAAAVLVQGMEERLEVPPQLLENQAQDWSKSDSVGRG